MVCNPGSLSEDSLPWLTLSDTSQRGECRFSMQFLDLGNDKIDLLTRIALENIRRGTGTATNIDGSPATSLRDFWAKFDTMIQDGLLSGALKTPHDVVQRFLGRSANTPLPTNISAFRRVTVCVAQWPSLDISLWKESCRRAEMTREVAGQRAYDYWSDLSPFSLVEFVQDHFPSLQTRRQHLRLLEKAVSDAMRPEKSWLCVHGVLGVCSQTAAMCADRLNPETVTKIRCLSWVFRMLTDAYTRVLDPTVDVLMLTFGRLDSPRKTGMVEKLVSPLFIPHGLLSIIPTTATEIVTRLQKPDEPDWGSAVLMEVTQRSRELCDMIGLDGNLNGYRPELNSLRFIKTLQTSQETCMLWKDHMKRLVEMSLRGLLGDLDTREAVGSPTWQ